MLRNIIILVVLLILVGVIIFLDAPKVQKVLDLRNQIKEQNLIFSDKELLLAKVDNLKGAYEENKEDLEKTNYILPSSQDVPNLITQLEGLAFENGLILEEIGLATIEETGAEKAQKARLEEKAKKNYQVLSASLKLIGSYSSFKNFLKAVEDNIRLIDINSVNFKVETKEGIQLFESEVNLNTYYQ